jgi:hypothetical protein
MQTLHAYAAEDQTLLASLRLYHSGHHHHNYHHLMPAASTLLFPVATKQQLHLQLYFLVLSSSSESQGLLVLESQQ